MIDKKAKRIISNIERCLKGDCSNCEYLQLADCFECITYDLRWLINSFETTIDNLNVYIENQQAEIERLTINMNAFGLGMKREKEKADIIRAETIKEFADLLREFKAYVGNSHSVFITDEDIDNFVKEMTESEE